MRHQKRKMKEVFIILILLSVISCNYEFADTGLFYEVKYEQMEGEFSAKFEVEFVKKVNDTIIIAGRSGGGLSGVNFELKTIDNKIIKERAYYWTDIGDEEYKLLEKKVKLRFNKARDSVEVNLKLLGEGYQNGGKLEIAGIIYEKIRDENYNYKIAYRDEMYESILKAPEEIRLKIEHLNLERLNIKEIPDIVREYKNLISLNLSNNDLSEASNWKYLCELENLEILYLRKNKISIIPEDFKCLTRLKELNMWGNQIESIPTFIQELDGLEKIHIGSNKIKDQELNLSKLKKLKELEISNNPIKVDPLELLK